MLIMHMNKTTAKLTDDDRDVYYGRECDDVGICVINLACYTLVIIIIVIIKFL